MIAAGITAILLPCIASGYLLANAKLFRIMLPETPGSNIYFRMLVTGFLWTSLFSPLGILATAKLYACFPAILPAVPKQLLPGADAGTGAGSEAVIHWTLFWTSFLAGVFAVLLAAIARLFLDLVVYRMWHSKIMEFGDKAESLYERRFNLRILNMDARHMDVFVRKSMEERKTIMATMRDGKTYIGWPTSAENSKKPPEWLRFSPVASGYRDKETRETVITTYYVDPENADPERMREEGLAGALKERSMILSVKEIVSLQPFDFELHARICEAKKRMKDRDEAQDA